MPGKVLKSALVLLLLCLMLGAACASAETLTLPSGTKEIGNEAFYGVQAENAVLPSGLKDIGELAFAHSSLTSVNLPASVEHIADSAFLDCEGLTAAATRGSYAYDYCLRRGIAVYDPQAPAPQALAFDHDYLVDPNHMRPGMTLQLYVSLTPSNAATELTFASSASSIASVDQHGLVTALKKGEAAITVTAHNGVSASFPVKVTYDDAQLEYALLSDGSGYEITGCSSDAYTVNIPASYEGLPVKAIAGRAFINCTMLRSFTADADQGVFYADHGVLYTNAPVKTLVRCPNDYGAVTASLTVPADTVAVASYAFSGQQSLCYLHLQEGLTTMGSYVFAEINVQMAVYVPDSLTAIGSNLMQGQKINVPFFGHSDAYACQYAQQYNIPYGNIFDFEAEEQTVQESQPDLQDVGDDQAPQLNVVTVPLKQYSRAYVYGNMALMYGYDLTEYQSQAPDEVFLGLAQQWPEILPDLNGCTQNGFPAQTGLYGIGYTDGEALLRGYDLNGNAVCTRRVSGHFAFSMKGAFSLGVSGGAGTKIGVLPYQPIYVSDAGALRVNPSTLYRTPDGKAFQMYVMMFTNGSVSFYYPHYLNSFSHGFGIPGGGNYEDNPPYYSIMTMILNDPARIQETSLISLRFDYLKTLLKNSEITISAKASYGLTEEYAQRMYEVFQNTKQTMLGTYYPADAPISHVTVLVNGNYPSAFLSTIILDENHLTLDDTQCEDCAHEMVHAIDHSDMLMFNTLPASFYEGRAVYISEKVCERMNLSHVYYSGFSWSFLSEEDKADFFNFFYDSTNTNTQYTVGYYFIKYLCQNYGENVTAQVIANIRASGLENMSNITDSLRKSIFKDAVEAATETGVFQKFVQDVVEQE